jgi:hypothetical protein
MTMLVIASERDLTLAERVWGHGGWLMPEQREALDWATFGRLSGWPVRVAARPEGRAPRWLIIATDPDGMDELAVDAIADYLEREPVLVVTRAPAPGSPLARLTAATRRDGSTCSSMLTWRQPGAGKTWRCEAPVENHVLTLGGDTETWATVGRDPAVVGRHCGRGIVATLAFHPSAARDCGGAATQLLRRLITIGATDPVAWLDFERTVVLRMDDPGSAEAAYHRPWAHPRLGAQDWERIGDELARRRARMSLGYVSGWVDDADANTGKLDVDGRPARRVAGKVHATNRVRYTDVAGAAPGRVHDLATQAHAIKALRRRGLADVELHGFTHMHPDRVRWARARGRAEVLAWYRELDTPSRGADPLAAALDVFGREWGTRPTTVIPPGDAWSSDTLQRALELRLDLFDSYYLAIRDGEQWWWSQHVCSPYLDLAKPSWFTAGLPVVGYFHERDVALEGVQWLVDRLAEWDEAGARRYIDFRQLAAALACRLTVELRDGVPVVHLGSPTQGQADWPVPVKVQMPGADLPVACSARPASSEPPVELAVGAGL